MTWVGVLPLLGFHVLTNESKVLESSESFKEGVCSSVVPRGCDGPLALLKQPVLAS